LRKAIYASGTAAALFLVLNWALANSLPEAWRNWRYSRAIELDPTNQPRLVSFAVTPEVYPHAQTELQDLRLIDDHGTQAPYLLHARTGSNRSEQRGTRLLESSFTPGRFTQVVLDIGEKAPFHNAVQVVTPEQDFIAWVEVAVSDNAKSWRIVGDRAPIFRFRKEQREGNQTVPYSESNARYIRLRILDAAKRFPVTSAEASYHVTEEAERAPVPVPMARDAQVGPQTSVWRADLGAATPPISEVRLEVEQAEFHRAVRVHSSKDGQEWGLNASGEIYRFRQGDKLQEWLRIDFPQTRERRYWRVEVLNGSDLPLEGARPALYTTPQRVIFWQKSGRSYRLLYGQSQAKAPQYEMARLTDRKAIESAVPGRLGTEEVNAAYADPRPWTERHPGVIWVALGIAVALLGLSALQAMRR